MAWLCITKGEVEVIFGDKPYRVKVSKDGPYSFWCSKDQNYVMVPKGSIKKLIGRELCWNDQPVEI